MTDAPLSGGNFPSFWTKFLKEEGALLKEPSFSRFITPMLDWLETSRDILRSFWHLGVARRSVVEGVSPARVFLFIPGLKMLINLEDPAGATIPLCDRKSGKNIPIKGLEQ